jgi:hypothetical protein
LEETSEAVPGSPECRFWKERRSESHRRRVLGWEAAEKIFEIGGVFLGCVGETVFSPRSPRISPRLHQQKTTVTTADFPKHPSKTP